MRQSRKAYYRACCAVPVRSLEQVINEERCQVYLSAYQLRVVKLALRNRLRDIAAEQYDEEIIQ